MFKIKKLTKYGFFAIAIAFVIFIAVPNNAKAGDDYGYYSGSGDEYSDYSYSEPTYYEDTTPTYTEPATTYFPDTTPSYTDTTYYPDTSYYSAPSYSSYSSYGSGCSSCSSYNPVYTYTPPPQITYVPTPPVYYPPTPPVYYPPVNPPVYNNLDASCTINPSNVNINDTVTISGSATGGSGSYTYYWSGSDGISGSSQFITGRFTSYGSKSVTLTVTSGSQTITRTCNAYVNQNNYNYNNNNNYNYGYNYNNNYNTNLTATCVAQPVSANVGDNVIWTVYPTGGNGSYTYNWTGSDSLSYGNAYQIQQRYTTPGTKSATVTVYSTNGQSITATCNASIVGSVIQGTPISGVYLSEVPATGISFNAKVALYLLGLILWSAFVGFMIVEKKKSKLALANKSRIEDFKQENLKKRGL